ncbi:hypothetical protein CVV43_04550 [Candidatus Saccharibacteria bacterium HGW-Saccharibacteria-1]|jgi:hypothetical protein|nr:MAG: hypothetical protein CVV43_04550 [Candidatus Saccharibacteria bacterium HGW-Saccharibacteria-1]
MAKKTYYITPRSDGDWNVKREGADRASFVAPTQRIAEKQAKSYLQNNPSGGEVRIQGLDHKFRDSDTINRKDPNPPKDKRH